MLNDLSRNLKETMGLLWFGLREKRARESISIEMLNLAVPSTSLLYQGNSCSFLC